ncbi:hypothetical protein WMY93_027472 [Mugilogobius chulae]|uniref:PiggyBac transposable element-derived protein domain-containing protein n=1 Tax=Mugilogobius chulae TaxID=88201 RepID=A0AAW0MT05_9GOBI
MVGAPSTSQGGRLGGRGRGRGSVGVCPQEDTYHSPCLKGKTLEEQDDKVPAPPRFFPKRPSGVQPPFNTGNPEPGQIFCHFFDEELLQRLVHYTNQKAVGGKKFKWTPVAVEEMKKFVGVLFYMSVVRLPQITDYWRKGSIFSVSHPATVMSRDRLRHILSNLQLSDPKSDAVASQEVTKLIFTDEEELPNASAAVVPTPSEQQEERGTGATAAVSKINQIIVQQEVSRTRATVAHEQAPRPAKKRVWVIGESHVRRAAQLAAVTRGNHLGLSNTCICWFGCGGLHWNGLVPFFNESLQGRALPDVLLINCGGNDLGFLPSVKLVNVMKEDLLQFHCQHPGMQIILSAIPQRRRYKAGPNPAKFEKARRFVNSFMTAFMEKRLVHYTNQKAVCNLEKGKKIQVDSVTVEEMKKFVGVLFYMSVVRLPQITDYWRKEFVFSVSHPATVMSRDRFRHILSNLQLSDPKSDAENDAKKGMENYDPIQCGG